MAEVVWTEHALSNLNDIAEYIGFDNVSAAEKLVCNVLDSVERLEAFPESGRIPSELDHLGYREVVVSPCRIFYKVETNRVYILFVMCMERDLRRYILNQL